MASTLAVSLVRSSSGGRLDVRPVRCGVSRLKMSSISMIVAALSHECL